MPNVLFIHRSVGRNLLRDGNMRELIQQAGSGLVLDDYDQNNDTLTNSGGHSSTMNFTFPGSNTRPQDYARIFTGEAGLEYQPIRDFALAYDIVVIKSCYPNSNIADERQLDAIKGYYTSIAEFFATQPRTKLVIMTSPPLAPLMTRPGRAERGRELADWLASTDFASNIFVYNLYDELADPDKHWLKRNYRRWLPTDSHPNAIASQDIAPRFITFLQAIEPS